MDNFNEHAKSDDSKEKKGFFGKMEKSSVRTMESDISKFMKEEKPSVIGLVTKRRSGEFIPSSGRSGGFPWKMIATILFGITVLVAAGYYGYTYFLSSDRVINAPVNKEEKQILYVPSEEGRIIVVKDKNDLISKVQSISEDSAQFGIVNTIQVKTGEPVHIITFKDFLRLLDVTPPSDLEYITLPPVQLFLYQADSGPVLGSVFSVTDATRALQNMITWEPDLVRDLQFYLMSKKSDIAISFFEDRSHNGVPYRFAKLSFTSDFGIGYAVMPTKNFIVITTSEEAMRIIINRLLQ